jgi:hypothetical protein
VSGNPPAEVPMFDTWTALPLTALNADVSADEEW